MNPNLAPLVRLVRDFLFAHPRSQNVSVTGRFVPDPEGLGWECSETVIAFADGASFMADRGGRRAAGTLTQDESDAGSRVCDETWRYCCGCIRSGETLTVTRETDDVTGAVLHDPRFVTVGGTVESSGQDALVLNINR